MHKREAESFSAVQRPMQIRVERTFRRNSMSNNKLEDVTGIGKRVIIRNKQTGVPFTVGRIVDEVSTSDGEQRYFIQQIELDPNVSAEGDDTRFVYRIGYYTRRTDGRLCLGSQFTPILTPSELHVLLALLIHKEWFK